MHVLNVVVVLFLFLFVFFFFFFFFFFFLGGGGLWVCVGGCWGVLFFGRDVFKLLGFFLGLFLVFFCFCFVFVCLWVFFTDNEIEMLQDKREMY